MNDEKETAPLRTEAPRPEPDRKTPENLLDLDHHHATYGRLLLASSMPDNVKDIIDPEKKDIDQTLISAANFGERHYNPIVLGLSMSERKASWEEIVRTQGLEEAKRQWREGFYSSINLRSEGRDNVVKHFFNVGEISEVTADVNGAIDRIYDEYCNDESNVERFVKKALENPDLDKSEVEWLARKLFGKDSAIVVSRLLELESSASADLSVTRNLLFGSQDKLARINSLLPEEERILNLLVSNYTKPEPAPQPNPDQTPPDPAQTPPKPRQPRQPRQTPLPQPTQQPPRRPPEDRTQEERKGKAETAEEAKANVDFEYTLLRSRMVVKDKAGERYSVKKTEPGAPSPGVANLDDLYNLVRISDGRHLPSMKKGELIALIQSPDTDFIRDPLERKKVKSKSDKDDGIYILQTNYDVGKREERIQLRVKFKEDDGSWYETIEKSYLRSDFDRTFQDEYEIVDDGIPTRQPTTSPETTEPQATPQSHTDFTPSGIPEIRQARTGQILIESTGQNMITDLNRELTNNSGIEASFAIPLDSIKNFLLSSAGGQVISEGSIKPMNGSLRIDGLVIHASKRIEKLGKEISKDVTLSLTLVNQGGSVVAVDRNFNYKTGLAEKMMKPFIDSAINDALDKISDSFRDTLMELVKNQNPTWRPSTIAFAENRVLIGFTKAS